MAPPRVPRAIGQCPICAAIVIGAGIGAGLDIIGQLAQNGGHFGCIDWWEVAATGAEGGLTGLGGLGPLLEGAAAEEAATAAAARAAAEEGIGGVAPDFIVSSDGTVFPVPEGAQGPIPVVNQAGNQTGLAYTGGSGGINRQVNTMRIMDPTPPRGNSPGYPNGYIKYENRLGQGVDPYTGRTIPNSHSHFPVK